MPTVVGLKPVAPLDKLVLELPPSAASFPAILEIGALVDVGRIEAKWYAPKQVYDQLVVVVELFTEKLIPFVAEVIDAPGEVKFEIVTDRVMQLLDLLEAKVNLLPPGVQYIAFKLVRRGIRKTVQRIFDMLRTQGLV